MSNQNPKKAWWREGVAIFMRVSVWVFVPVVLSLLLGKFLDKQFGTKPWIFLSLTGVAFIISMFGIVRSTKKEMAKFEKKDGNNS